MRFDQRVVTVTVTPSAALFARFDDDRDGRLSRKEVRAHRPAMVDHLLAGLEVVAPGGRKPTLQMTDLNPPHVHGAASNRGETYVRATFKFRFDTPVNVLTVRYRHGRLAPLVARVIRWSPGRGARPVEEQAHFNADLTDHTFFRTQEPQR